MIPFVKKMFWTFFVGIVLREAILLGGWSWTGLPIPPGHTTVSLAQMAFLIPAAIVAVVAAIIFVAGIIAGVCQELGQLFRAPITTWERLALNGIIASWMFKEFFSRAGQPPWEAWRSGLIATWVGVTGLLLMAGIARAVQPEKRYRM
ncbi:MAG TPA: hypothetical protein DCY48_00950 [Candidatus Magasanikbacteria bacterium]|nr:MAG: hypothetical protein A3I74_01960 [Candidatus Magasanikbacteria bacterium RIFCSPLOWO2_02_FULL_47_16]OGH83036.1 MAG: hypothetical protein A3G08_01305 [Candidatus Magasanikbacteria bacterium RIFCSPLOWO2_12_FULL_47_9b]HAZ28328.1 hypothetical protein [Candidatus Magasanikbacteria bacterium]